MSVKIQQPWPLKLKELEVSPDEPWCDDELGRTKVAEALTNLVWDQSQPLTVALHGEWGTGKTFLLKRWQQDLENNGFKSIYFNAWEDDFCDDPFVAIIGQLSEFLAGSKHKDLQDKIRNAAKFLVKSKIINVINRIIGEGIDLEKILDEFSDRTLNEYAFQHEKKNELKQCLEEMTDKVTTGRPLIFIIDELDRCRPTFAIELLERVKHIFDIPGMVFVFGVNHDELCNSIKLVYGEIDTKTYLRRFFDMNLLLPEADIEKFCRYMMKKYELQKSFDSLAGNNIHQEDFDMLNRFLPQLYNQLNLSLRDIDHCIRSIAFVGKGMEKTQRMHYPFLVSALIFLRLKNQPLYRKFITGECFGAEVMDYINEIRFEQDFKNHVSSILDTIEIDLYFIDTTRGRPSIEQFRSVLGGKHPPNSEYLSKKTREMLNRVNFAPFDNQSPEVIRVKEFYSSRAAYPQSYQPDIRYISSLIELVPIPNR